jgi:hypothetical protein
MRGTLVLSRGPPEWEGSAHCSYLDHTLCPALILTASVLNGMETCISSPNELFWMFLQPQERDWDLQPRSHHARLACCCLLRSGR